MRLVIALGGNALLRRGDPVTAEVQRTNVGAAARSLAPAILNNQVVITHGNGPQIGLLALQQTSKSSAAQFPLDILGAQTEGMIGYLIEQELDNLLPPGKPIVSLLTRVLVDQHDAAFRNPTKFVGPIYDRETANEIGRRQNWPFRPDGVHWRRVVPCPTPLEIREARVISLLMEHDVTVICAGGGGIPVIRQPDGNEIGVEAVVDKDSASVLLARLIDADALIMLTDVKAVEIGFGTPGARPIRHATPEMLATYSFAPGSMGPKVDAACSFVRQTGKFAAIGALHELSAILDDTAGTRIAE
jgi:carbamate kinase